MPIQIISVAKGSIAAKAGIKPGEILMTINGEPVLDEIDYQFLTQGHRLRIELMDSQEKVRSLRIYKNADTPLGLKLDERIILQPRVCKNHCIFCFVDQMPKGMRETLYVKDDDWRLSLMMGNFVTLTNVDDQEFQRILCRKASPLYISVHATDPETRRYMLRNPNAGNILERLRRLSDAGIHFHGQVVLCPGINDGPILHQTIVDMAELFPAAQSLAIVPVGLTGYRENLSPLRPFTAEEAREIVRDCELIQEYYYQKIGTRFLFLADEFYSIAGLSVPDNDSYESYPQIENGIGMIRQLAEECADYWPRLLAEQKSAIYSKPSSHILIPTGVSALPYIKELVEKYARAQDHVEVFAVPNRFFGPSVTVTGLITGKDLLSALEGKTADRVMISRSMLRENDDTLLDDLSVGDLQMKTGLSFRVVMNQGSDFLNALYGA